MHTKMYRIRPTVRIKFSINTGVSLFTIIAISAITSSGSLCSTGMPVFGELEFDCNYESVIRVFVLQNALNLLIVR